MAKVQKAPRGVVTLQGSDGTTHTLKFGTNAICRIQDALNQTLGQILASINDPERLDMKVIRTMVQCSLVNPVSDEQAGDLIDDVGLAAITEAFGAVFVQEGTANPRPGAANGGASASTAPPLG